MRPNIPSIVHVYNCVASTRNDYAGYLYVLAIFNCLPEWLSIWQYKLFKFTNNYRSYFLIRSFVKKRVITIRTVTVIGVIPIHQLFYQPCGHVFVTVSRRAVVCAATMGPTPRRFKLQRYFDARQNKQV